MKLIFLASIMFAAGNTMFSDGGGNPNAKPGETPDGGEIAGETFIHDIKADVEEKKAALTAGVKSPEEVEVIDLRAKVEVFSNASDPYHKTGDSLMVHPKQKADLIARGLVSATKDEAMNTKPAAKAADKKNDLPL